MTPRVSILVPVYNREALVGPCIESARAQTLADIEIVVVDNASTDGTWQECQRQAAQDPRVRAFRNDTNLGPVGNWQRCLVLARAPLAKLLFSDDTIEPEYLEHTVPLLERPDVGFAFTAVRMGASRESGILAYDWPEQPVLVGREQYLEVALRTDRLPLSPGAALFRLEDLRRNLRADVPAPVVRGFRDTGAGLDLLTYLLTAAAYPRVAHVPKPLAFFHAHPGSITLERRALVLDQYLQARIWFTQQHDSPVKAREIVLRYWWAHSHERRSVLPFAEFSAKFLGAPLQLGPLERLWLWRRSLRLPR